MSTQSDRRWPAPVAVAALAMAWALVASDAAATGDDGVATSPFTVTYDVRPLVLFALSNDHQLYKKAYNDYSDLNGDGAIDTAYDNAYDYLGYFDSHQCYRYDTGLGYFLPEDAATDHRCNGLWSGNLLNWASMTRMDILRKVLYGGYRSTDTDTQTVLERVLLPTDVHAFAKVFAPGGGTAEMALYTPYRDSTAETAITLCNVTWATAGESQSLDTVASPPLIRVARGIWRMWGAGEVVECAWRDEYNNPTAPYRSGASSSFKGEYKARVAACVAGREEDNCARYPNGQVKPRGLLQDYGEDGRLRFGLISGSYTKNKSGGVLRRNVGRIAGNAEAALNEIDIATGRFTGNPGIVKTIDTFRINKYSYTSRKYTDGCDSPGILTFLDGKCTNWGNPVAEIQLEALHYFAGKTGATPAFAGDDRSGSYGTYFSALAPVAWTSFMPPDEWCARCNIVILSTGVSSFDRDQLASTISGLAAADQTDGLGQLEGLGSSYILGGTTGQCTAKTIGGLSQAQGICPDGPTLQGGFHVAGLARYAHDNDLRPADRDGDQYVYTRAVALARDLPRFRVAVGDKIVTILPHAEANSSAGSTSNPSSYVTQSSSGWRASSLVDLIIERLDYLTDAQGNWQLDAQGDRLLVGGRILIPWEDSTWGSDYDMDGTVRLEFCVGALCSQYDALYGNNYGTNGATSAGELRVVTSAQHVYAGHSLLFGFTVTGTNNGSTPPAPPVKSPPNIPCDGAYHGDGVYREVVRQGAGGNFSLLSSPQDNPSRKPADCVRRFTAGATATGLLENPLWYTAKYGSYDDSNYNQRPDRVNEWDAKPDGNPDGEPDGFFFADNPSELGQSLSDFLEVISTTSSSASVAANSITLNQGTLIYQARYDSGDWSGDLVALPVNEDGTLGAQAWSARSRLNARSPGSRRIATTNEDTRTGVPFQWGDATSDNDDGIATGQKLLLCPSCTPQGSPPGIELGEARLRWLRGDRSEEIGNGDLDLRARRHVLGDLVNSEPIYVGRPEANLPPTLEIASYLDWAEAPAQLERTPMVYVGGNDGMLHGFSSLNGDEVLAYVPRAVYPNLAHLTQSVYSGTQHRYYVDGGPTVGDAYLGAALGWRTVLVGGLAGGGAGMYALDITSPATLATDEASVADRVLWDIAGTDADFADLGYAFGKPAIVRLPDDSHGGRWAAVFGNGYADLDGRAVLYVVDLATGQRLARVVADPGPGNGLSSVSPVDYDGDARVDFIYAGDLKGSLWRFEPDAGGEWQVSYQGHAVFSTAGEDSEEEQVVQRPIEVCEWVLKNPSKPRLGYIWSCHTEYEQTTEIIVTPGPAQPITVRPEAVRHPNGGTLVLFGSGSYYRTEDQTPHPETTHNFYGVWDRYLPGETPAEHQPETLRRWHLARQTIVAEQRVGLHDVRATSSNPVVWREAPGLPADNPPSTHLGWYLELVSPSADGHRGEIQVTDPILRGGRIIFTTMIPSQSNCTFSGDGWLMELRAIDGRPIDEVLFDLDGDRDFDTDDLASIQSGDQTLLITPSGKKSKVAAIQEPAIVAAGTREYKFASGAREAGIDVTTENGSPNKGGRRSWVQLH